jgi:Immunity protein Imm1
MLAYWSDLNSQYTRKVDTAVQALDLIGELTSSVGTPAIVEFRDDASGLAFGYAVGRRRTVLTFQETREPPYYISIGDPDQSGVEWFCYGKQYSEYMLRNLIDHVDAQRALREFFDSEELPGSVKWERL